LALTGLQDISQKIGPSQSSLLRTSTPKYFSSAVVVDMLVKMWVVPMAAGSHNIQAVTETMLMAINSWGIKHISFMFCHIT
jgi:hypothetical protein